MRSQITLERSKDSELEQWAMATRPFPCLRRFSMMLSHCRSWRRSLGLSEPHRSCIIFVLKRLPLGDVGPIALLLCLIEIRIEIDDVLLEETFAKRTCSKFLGSVSSLELPILLLADVSSDLGWHSRYKWVDNDNNQQITYNRNPFHQERLILNAMGGPLEFYFGWPWLSTF
jgi:hypothetical protein